MSRRGLIFVHPSDELYGADRVLLELTTALPVGAHVEVWLPTDLAHPVAPLCIELAGRPVVVRHVDLPILRRAQRRPGPLLRLGWRCVKLMIRFVRVRPKVVYCTTSAALLAAPVARIAGVPLVVGHLQEVWPPSDRRLLAALARACHRLIAVSSAAVAELPATLASRATVVPNSTPRPLQLDPLADRTGPLHFVVASRWTPRKGHATLFRAWDQLAKPGRLTILGGPPASGRSVDVPAQVAALRHRDSVHVLGEQRDVAASLNAADVAVVPSDEPESFGLVAIEAFAHGRPVVAAASGGLTEVITEGETGWLYPAGDADALAALLGRLSRDEVIAAGANARWAYEQRFTSGAFARQWNAAMGDLDSLG